jgi:hypothetical protein
MLRSRGVTQAWVGSFDALLHEDPAAVNSRLAAQCAAIERQFLVPFGVVNPTLPDWEEDLRRCDQVHGMPGIRIHPNYHGYKLDNPRCVQLFEQVQQRGLIVQIAVQLEDARTQHPLVQVPQVDLGPLDALVEDHPKLRIVLLGALRHVDALRPEVLQRLTAGGNVTLDIALLEGIGALGRLVEVVGHEAVLFGSLSPLYYFEAARLKLRESALPGVVAQAVQGGNARRLLKAGQGDTRH